MALAIARNVMIRVLLAFGIRISRSILKEAG
jgi:hypothetical protein